MKNFATQRTVLEIIVSFVVLMFLGISGPALAQGQSYYSSPPQGIRVLDSDGLPRDSFSTGESFTVEVSFLPKDCMTYDKNPKYKKKSNQEIHIMIYEEYDEAKCSGDRTTSDLEDSEPIVKEIEIENPPKDSGNYEVLVFFGESWSDKEIRYSISITIGFGRWVGPLNQSENRKVFCEDYAQKAVEQYKRSQREDCRNIPAPSNRWRDDYNAHYGWCLELEDTREADEETRERDILLQECLADSCVLYEDHNFKGQSFFIEPGESYSDLGRVSWDDRVSSVKVPPECTLVLHTYPYHEGGKLVPNKIWFELDYYDDQISSAECICE